MLEYGLTDKDRDELESPKTVYSGFGRDGSDYIHLYVYDMEDKYVDDDIFPAGEVKFPTPNLVDLDIGTHLRTMGLTIGEFKVKYLFLRRLAGKKEDVLTNDDGFIHIGKAQVRMVNGRTRYFSSDKEKLSEGKSKELVPKKLQYRIKQISPNRREIKVDIQKLNNVPYQKDFASINKDMVYTPKKNVANAGKIKFDKTDGNVLQFIVGRNERGFTDSMVGGQIVIPGAFEYKVSREIIKDIVVKKQVDNKILDKEVLKKVGRKAYNGALKGKPEPVIEQIADVPAPDDTWQELDRDDDYGSVCFVGDTKIKLSNNRTLPIKMMKPGMKVKTEQGFAKVLKVVKDNRPYGDKLVRIGKLITTDHHPIKHRGKWYMANEVGTEFKSSPLDVWNLILDKHHTIYADNVVSATLGKWRSMEHFLHMRNHRINMLRLAEDFGDGQDGVGDRGTGGGAATSTPSTVAPTNEWIIDEPVIPVTREVVDDIVRAQIDDEIISVIKELPEDEPLPPPEVVWESTPVDYVATIVEVLDNNRVRVDVSYEEGANQSQHNGEDFRNSLFDEFYVNYRKNKISRLNNYMVTEHGYHLAISILDSPNDVLQTDPGIIPFDSVSDKTARYFKFYKPLPEELEVGDLTYFVEEKMEAYEDKIKLIPFVEEDEEYLFLRVPNLNSTSNPINFRGTHYRKYDDLLSSDTSTNEDIMNSVHSSSLLDVQLNIDYNKRTNKLSADGSQTDYGFGNFVQFSSAETRLRNFRKKIELVEKYTSASLSIAEVSSSASAVSDFNTKKRQVINSLGPYENYLYTVSSSYASSSIGEFYDASWPKHNATTLYHTSSSNFTSWWNTWVGYSREYDRANMDRLTNQLPAHVNQDTQNEVFLDFMDMVGEQFDETWSYLRHFTDINERVPNVSEGISKDIVREVAKSMGFEVNSGNDLVILPTYLLGKSSTGAALNETPSEAITEEIWKRILSNLPFFLKNKGTIRAMKGLINCYGIPSSILRVREYGGPDLNDRVSYEIKRKFTYALDFKSDEYLITEWKNDGTSGIKPETIEFRFRSPISKNQVIVESEDKWAIELTDNGAVDNLGRLQFSISGSSANTFITSSLLPFYNDDMWSVMVTRKLATGNDLTADTATQNITYELTTKQYDASREQVVFANSSSITTNTSNINTAFVADRDLYIGGASGSDKFHTTRFSGSLMEFRLWSEPLSQSVFDNHVRAPKAYNGNTTSSMYDNLIFRLPLADNTNLQSSPESIDDKSFTSNYFASASAKEFSGNSFRSLVDKEQLRSPNIGPARRNATKIRTEASKLLGNLSSNIRQEVSAQSFAPIDSNKLGVYFSPVDVVNEDIMYSLADINLDNEIGDPRDQFKPTYRGLERVQSNYWKKYSRSNNFWDYMRIINFFDRSLFDQLSKLVPARANTNLGLLIEPNILERSKEVIGHVPEFENLYIENAGHFDDGLQLTSRLSSSATPHPFTISSEYRTYNGAVNLHNTESGSLGTLGLPTLNKINELNPASEYSNTYATASITIGDIELTFEETFQPFVSSSRISEHNEEKRLFFATEADAAINNPNSSSFHPSEHQSVAYESSLFRLFYKQELLTKNNTIDGKEPVEITITSPTKLVTQEPGDSKLKVD
tara:strand:- start:6540 stop:11420 length:4881 start_codon:yes stop_codon:yes gene_type:complete